MYLLTRFYIILLVGSSGGGAMWKTNPLMRLVYTFLPHHSSDESSTSQEIDCADCEQINKINVNDPDLLLTELRVEYVKHQILKKLRLSKPPEVSMPLSTLPKPLINGNVLELQPGTSLEEKPAENFYGKTDQIVVFPNQDAAESTRCRQNSNHITGFNPAACFTFNLPKEMLYVDVTLAELWFYKEQVENDDELNQTFVLSELDHWDQGGSFEKNTIMAIFETDVKEGWIKTDIKFMVKKWVDRHKLNHVIQIGCNTCSIDRDTAPVSLVQSKKPFLVIYTAPLPQRNRPKRFSNCHPEMKECCRDELYIDFRDIGWNDWILFPTGYHAYFCRGSCTTAASLTVSGSQYNNIILKLLTKDGGLKNKITPCCSPTQLAPLQMLYIDNNNTITRKTLPNMVVEACGCM